MRHELPSTYTEASYTTAFVTCVCVFPHCCHRPIISETRTDVPIECFQIAPIVGTAIKATYLSHTHTRTHTHTFCVCVYACIRCSRNLTASRSRALFLSRAHVYIHVFFPVRSVKSEVRQPLRFTINHTMHPVHPGGDANRMLSCGRDNVRVWRVRHGALRSSPVNLARHHDDAVVFTALAFHTGASESASGSTTTKPSGRRKAPGSTTSGTECVRVFVASSGGRVLDIDIETMRLLAVHTLSSDGITCMSSCDAFIATGGVDGRLWVWPLDFSESFMVAEHNAALTNVGVCANNGLVLAGTQHGTLGVLDIATKEHTTVMRSHTADVVAVVMHRTLPQFASLSNDMTIRVWCLETHAQLFEFTAPEDAPSCGDYHPAAHLLCCGTLFKQCF